MTETTAEFRGGRRQPLTERSPRGLAAAVAAAKEHGGFVLVCVDDPDESALNELSEELGLHPLAVADAISSRQQPKVQSYEEHLFVVLWALLRKNDSAEVTISQVFVFVREGLLLVVRHKSDEVDMAEMIEKAFERVDPSVLGALYVVMNQVVCGYTEETDRVERELEKLESQVFDGRVHANVQSIYRLRRQMGRVQRAIAGLAAALEASKDHLSQLSVGHELVEPYFRDLLDDLAGTNQLVSDQDRALDGVLASHENNVAIRQSDDTRKISAYAALLSVPTVLAGLYGMNFKNLPGVHWAFGWEAIIAVVLIIDPLLYVAFKRRDWL